MTFGYSLFYFISGALMYGVLSRIAGLYQGINLFRKMEKFTSVFVVTLSRTVGIFLESHLQIAKDSGLDAKTVKELEEANFIIQQLFKKSVLVIMQTNCPREYLPHLRSKSWSELEQYVSKIKKRS